MHDLSADYQVYPCTACGHEHLSARMISLPAELDIGDLLVMQCDYCGCFRPLDLALSATVRTWIVNENKRLRDLL